jgi:hypothetical protein
MKGDFTRDSFDPLKHFSRVLMQQGRVQLDADWNEQLAILLHYIRTLASDLIGPYAGPEKYWGFEIFGSNHLPDLNKLKETEPSLTKVKHQDLIDSLGSEGGFLIGPGRYYVDGILCENEHLVHCYHQPDCGIEADKLGNNSVTTKYMMVYLDVWERHITYIEDDDIREKALGGPDTTTRAKTVWQVTVKESGGTVCPDGTTALNEEIAISEACLRARARRERRPTEPCLIEPQSRYRGTENQLYRVEIHDGGIVLDNDDAPTFKWSRENGSIVFPIKGPSSISIGGKNTSIELELLHLGRDGRLGLSTGDWVEIVDDTYVLRNQAHPLFRVKEVSPMETKVTVAREDGNGEYCIELSKHAFLRRWDQKRDLTSSGVVLIEEDDAWETGGSAKWIELEDGIKIQFNPNGTYRTGDYWLIPARTALGDVEWAHEIDENGEVKRDKQGNMIARFLPPRGVFHHYAPLAIISIDKSSTVSVVHDCRCGFKPLSYDCDYNYAGSLGIGLDLLCPEPQPPAE